MRFKCQNGPFANHKLFLGKEAFEFTTGITGLENGMKFRLAYSNSKPLNDIMKVIEKDIETHDSDRGSLEDAEARIDRLATLIGYITQQLPPEAIKNVAELMGWEVTS